MPKRIKNKKVQRSRHFIKEWRKFRGLTVAQLADRLSTSNASISRIENGEQPYTQDFLDACADALSTDSASLIMRNPLESAGIWTIWEKALPAEREQIVSVAEALTKKRA